MNNLFERFPLENTSWRQALEDRLQSEPGLEQGILAATESDFLPPPEQVFAALESSPPASTKVVIVGQDPYPTPGDAHGLAFSVEHGKPPRSLVNIFSEIHKDYPDKQRHNANLGDWAKQGVLLLNRALTVVPGKAGSHAKCGWHHLTEAILKQLAHNDGPLVLMLWGSPARTAAPLFSKRKQTLVLESRHPSPLSYNRAAADSFKDCGHFKACNDFLIASGLSPIDW